MLNWKTTVSGVLAAVAMTVKQLWPDLGVIADAAVALAMALLGYFASDSRK